MDGERLSRVMAVGHCWGPGCCFAKAAVYHRTRGGIPRTPIAIASGTWWCLDSPGGDFDAVSRGWSRSFAVLVAGRGQAQGLPLPGGFGRRLRGWRGEGRHKACPYRGGLGGDCAGGGARAGTRPAPTGGIWAETARVAGRGQAQGLPLPGGFGRRLRGWRGEGRHEACPYRGDLGGDGAGGGARAGTRPAPTGGVWAETGGDGAAPTGGIWAETARVAGRGQAQGLPLRGVWAEIARVAGRGQAQGLPLPGGFGRRRRGWRGEGRHEACPYRGGLGGDCAGGGARAGTRPAPTGGVWAEIARVAGRGQAQGLPLRGIWAEIARVAGRGQAQGLPLPGGFGRRRRGWRGEGRHEACPYRGGLGGDCAGGGARAGTRPAPTGGGLGGPYRGGLGGDCAGGGARAGTRPAPTGRFGGKGRRIWQSGHNCAIIYALQEVQYFRTSFQTQTYRRYQCSEASF